MRTFPGILIVTPTLGTRQQLLAEVVSWVAINLPGAQHILVCPAKKVADLKAAFSGVEVVADQGGGAGLYGAINNGVLAAKAWNWMTYINDDDQLLHDFPELIRRHVNCQSAEQIAYGETWYIDKIGRKLNRCPVERNPQFFASLMRQSITPFVQQGTLINRNVFEKLGGFDPKYKICADYDFFVRAFCLGFNFKYYPLDVGAFRIVAGQVSGDLANLGVEMNMIKKRPCLQSVTKLACFYGRWRFRFLNFVVYLERIQKTGKWRTGSLLSSLRGQKSPDPSA